MHEKVLCDQCHVKPVFTDVGKNCQDCHTDVHNRQMGTNCADCHTVQGWNIAVQQVKDHMNRFPLLGAHAAVLCEDCHKGAAVGQFLGLSTACISCHQTDYQRTTNPNHVAGGFPTTCADAGCHNFDSWLGATFNHAGPPANFPLMGAHATLACTTCHVGGIYTNFTGKVNGVNDCGNSLCHLTTWQQTTNPKHTAAPNVFPIATCSTCHNTTSWLTAIFDHSTTGFPLANAHQMAPAGKVNACTDCHINDNYNLTTAPTDCGNGGCHLNTNYGGGWQGTNNPPHSSAGPLFAAANCSTCHNTISFLTATFDHSTTGWPLVGSHQMAPAGKVNACTDCHVNNNYTFTAANTDCYGCHMAAWNSTPSFGGAVPNHITAGFPTSLCSQCHDTIVWTDSTFNHANTGFPLTNSHQTVPAGKVTGCDQCHVGNYSTLTVQPTDCGNSQCHLNQFYGGGWQGTTNPAHAAAPTVFPVASCSTCHNTISFLNANFDHSTTGFPLANSHQMAPAGKVNACTDCHINSNYTLTIQPTDCGNAGCHLNTNYGGGWAGTNNPVHSSAGATFAAANCSTCHNTISFLTATFDHSTTGFPLTNSHQLAPAGKVNACTDCHISNNYTLTIQPTDCGNAQCHLTTWNTTPSFGGAVPNHITAGFPISICSQCHDTITWLDSTFNHANTGFPLTNSHQTAPAGKVTGCDQCHVGNYSTMTVQPTDCGNALCHLNQFYGGGWQGTNNPVHSTAGAQFAAANCSTCHNTITFLTATFDHSTTGFPLTNSHQLAPAGKVNACTDCHISNNYTLTIQPTDCGNAQCHLTTWNTTPSFGGAVPNHITAGFPISICSQCHDTIVWTDSTFNHANTGFPLTNSHQLAPAGKATGCDQCHLGNYSTLAIQPTDCANAQCHLTTYNGTNNPVHSSAGTVFAAANCSTCHSTITWTTATFDHSTTGFPLTGAHQLAPAGKAVACTDCHVANNYTTGFPPMDCGNSGCHLKDWNNTPTFGGNVPNHLTAGFPITMCSTCHDTLLWTDGKFDHSTTGFALQGPHMLPPRTTVTGAVGTMVNACTDCHIGGNYTTGYPTTDCYGCHATYYTNAQTYGGSVPNHVTANYPTTCISCHTTYVTTAWLGAVFNHTYFKIPHHSSVCSDCHINATNYATFSCENCHTTPTAHQPGMSHDNVCSPSPACWYNPPTRCYDCHKG